VLVPGRAVRAVRAIRPAGRHGGPAALGWLWL